MKPYFETSHLAAVLLQIATLAWGTMELAKATSTREGPHFVPAAAIRPGAAAFAAGMVVLVGGLVLRGWSIRTLGDYFTGRVMVSADQPVITAGPYRVLRHPSYTGFLVACAGVGLASANWVGLAAMVLLPLAVFFWRIHAEETALIGTLGERYRAYAAQHRRLVPFIW